MSEERRQRKLGFELGILLELPFDGLLPIGGTDQGLGLESGLCKSQIRGLRSQCTRSFSITGVRQL